MARHLFAVTIGSLALVASLGTGACDTFGDVTVPATQACPDRVEDVCGPRFQGFCDADCEGGKPDGECTAGTLSSESCSCEDCKAADFCVAACIPDGSCDLAGGDSCLCTDCDRTGYCYSLAIDCCTNDGYCDSRVEDCTCADCASLKLCTQNLATCDGGALDGTCADAEACSCPECQAVLRCAVETCELDGVCGDKEACLCNDCLSDPTSCPCTNDGVCDALNERCDCADCQTESFCDDGGLGGGGLGGGSAGAGGSGGASGGPSSAGGSGL